MPPACGILIFESPLRECHTNKKATPWVVFLLVDLRRFVQSRLPPVFELVAATCHRHVAFLIFESPLRECHTNKKATPWVVFLLVDLRRFELPTPTMRMWCAPSCATSPYAAAFDRS